MQPKAPSKELDTIRLLQPIALEIPHWRPMAPTHSNSPPSLALGGLSLWGLGRAAPGAACSGGAWLRVEAECAAPGATVTASGPLLSVEDLGRLLAGMKSMHKWEASSARLNPLEPNLVVSLTGNSRGGVRIDVRITPDSMTQEHRFFFDADLSYLLGPIEQCREILRRFPEHDSAARAVPRPA